MSSTSGRVRTLQLVVLAVILLVGCALRVRAVPRQFAPDACQQYDVYRYYVSTADAWLAGEGWVADYEWNYIPPPLQAVFVVAVRTLLPTANFGTMRGVQAVVSVATILLAGWIGLQLGGRWTALAAAGLVAIDLDVIRYVGVLLAETNYFFLLFAFLGLLLHGLRRDSSWVLAASGAALGLTSLMKPFPMFLSIAIPAWLMLRERNRRALIKSLVFTGAFVVVVAPWLAHNYSRYNEFYPISTNSGTLLAQSNFAALDSASPEMIYWEQIYKRDVWKDPEIEMRFEGVTDRHGKQEWNLKDRAYARHAIAYALGHPLHFLRNYAVKLYNVFRYPWWPGHAYRSLVMVLGIVGLTWCAVTERGAAQRALLLVVAYYASLTALMHIVRSGRMNLPLMLLLSLFAAWLLGRAAGGLARRYGLE